MKKKYNGLVIADVHVGAIAIEKLYDEFYHMVIKRIDKDNLDFIIICGDWFDHKLFLNDKESYYSYKIIQDLIDATRDDIKIRFVYGTESHECDQYDIISTVSNRDIRVIKYVDKEELFPGVNVLYLPEEHIGNKEEYYKEFFKKKEYDYVFGHGIIRESMKMAALSVENSTSKRKKVPVFSSGELRYICKGETYFGHYHVNTDMDDVYYVGSFTRWQFGEEEPKGYYKITVDTKKKTYDNEFVENTMAEMYVTIRYGYNNPVFKSVDAMEKKLKDVDNIVDSHMLDHVRFQFNIPKDSENPEFIMNYIRERYKFKDNIKIGFEHGYIEEKKKQEKEKVKEENDKYSFIFDKNMPFQNKVSLFINIDYEKDVSPDDVDIYLNKPLNEIVHDKSSE